MSLPAYIDERLRGRWPTGVPVVPDSTPVLSFGDPSVARVATLGLNPSLREFRKPSGELLAGEQRRLADLKHLGVATLEDAPADVLAQVKQACDDYFQLKPYRWFNALEKVLAPRGWSYFDRSACHLDLVQWATDPVWSHLPGAQKAALIESDAAFLARQLQQENVKLVLANGQAVVTALRKLVSLEIVDVISNGNLSAKIVYGSSDGVRFAGWSCNLQSQAGALALIPHINEALVRVLGEQEQREMSYLDHGTVVESKEALYELLRGWLNQSDTATIGDVGTFGGKAWVYVELPNATVVLNADTKRQAVAEFVRAHAEAPDGLAWRVVANRSGKVNKVLYGDLGSATGWYAYTLNELDAPVVL